MALSLVSPEEQSLLQAIEKLLKYSIPRQFLPEFPRYAASRVGKPTDNRKAKGPAKTRKRPEKTAPDLALDPATVTSPVSRRKKELAPRPLPKTGRRGSRSK
jgi:ATP-dependent RNA helicase RhlE